MLLLNFLNTARLSFSFYMSFKVFKIHWTPQKSLKNAIVCHDLIYHGLLNNNCSFTALPKSCNQNACANKTKSVCASCIKYLLLVCSISPKFIACLSCWDWSRRNTLKSAIKFNGLCFCGIRILFHLAFHGRLGPSFLFDTSFYLSGCVT